MLRRYRDGAPVESEAAVMVHVRHHGYPVPAVFRAEGPDLEMERITGPTMLDSVVAGDITADEAASLLADLHLRLHALPGSGTASGSGHPANTVVHLDLHPANVMLTTDGPSVIDWRNAADGPADLDVAMSAVILAQVATGTVQPLSAAEMARTESDGPAVADLAGAMLPIFIRRVGGDPGSMLDRAVTMRGSDPNLDDDERRGLHAAADLVREALVHR